MAQFGRLSGPSVPPNGGWFTEPNNPANPWMPRTPDYNVNGIVIDPQAVEIARNGLRYYPAWQSETDPRATFSDPYSGWHTQVTPEISDWQTQVTRQVPHPAQTLADLMMWWRNR